MTATLSGRPRFELNATSLMLMALMAATQLFAVGLIRLGQLPATTAPETVSTPQGGGLLGIIIVANSLALILLWRLWKRLPELFQRVGRVLFRGVVLAMPAYAIATALRPHTGTAAALAVAAVAVWAGYRLWRSGRPEWAVHNGAAFVLSVAAVAVAGRMLPPLAVVGLLAVVLLWDYMAVSRSGLMLELVELSASARIPNYYIIPAAWTVDYEGLRDRLTGERETVPDSVAKVIGVGDFVLPSLLVVAAATSAPSVVALAAGAGTVLSLGVLEAAHADGETLPALPWVNGGAIAGYGVVTIAVMFI